MSNKIAGLIACMVTSVGELSELQLNWRITTVPYGDLTVSGDKVVADLPFVRSYDDAVQQLRTMPRFDGGSNYGESTLEAVVAALGKPFRPYAVPVLVVLTDEPPLTEDLSEAEVGEQITIRETICFVAAPDLPGYRQWAEDNGGRWYKIGQAMDTTQMLAYLRSLVRELPQVAQEVHDLGGGSVRRYLQEKGDPAGATRSRTDASVLVNVHSGEGRLPKTDSCPSQLRDGVVPEAGGDVEARHGERLADPCLGVFAQPVEP